MEGRWGNAGILDDLVASSLQERRFVSPVCLCTDGRGLIKGSGGRPAEEQGQEEEAEAGVDPNKRRRIEATRENVCKLADHRR